jgi:hypothetical protein
MRLLKELPKPLKEISTHNTLEDDIEQVLRNELLNHFSTLKRAPDEFIANTSRKIKNNCMQAADRKARLSTSIMRFLEQALNKIIWNPHENLDIWRSVTLICSYLENIHDHALLDTPHFNQLLWSLLYQFGYFIECTGGQLPDECYKTIEQDLRGNKLTWLTYPELDKHLITKKEYLEKVISFGRLKKYSAERGILAEKIA